MPCTKCKDDKYKWGKTGECEYATKEACESANHKYSKMKPTPLGKKTYEEYEKELKEFNLSKVEKVQLGAIDDFKKLFEKSLDNWGNTSNSLIKAMSKTQQDYKAQKGKWEQVIKLGEGIEKDAKDLGVEIPKTVLGNKLLSAKDFIKESEKINQAIEKLYNIF
jgi:hypothetical protein